MEDMEDPKMYRASLRTFWTDFFSKLESSDPYDDDWNDARKLVRNFTQDHWAAFSPGAPGGIPTAKDREDFKQAACEKSPGYSDSLGYELREYDRYSVIAQKNAFLNAIAK